MKYLVVVDMQNDFIDGSLGTKEAESIVDKVAAKIEDFMKEASEGNADTHRILFTMDGHDAGTYLDLTQEGKLLPVEHCIVPTHGWGLNDKIYALGKKCTEMFGRDRTLVFDKDTFGSTGMGKYIELMYEIGYRTQEITLVGLCTDICVISNALLLKAFAPEAKIIVDASCCAGTTPENHENALKAMRQCQIFIENWEG